MTPKGANSTGVIRHTNKNIIANNGRMAKRIKVLMVDDEERFRETTSRLLRKRGFATTIAEPSLIAVSLKAQDVSGGTLRSFELRIAVAVGVAVGVSIGCYRIISGTPLPYYIMAGYALVIMQTFMASKNIIPLAYDTGGVTTSTVTVPVVAALGLGLASAIPGRSPLLDGFGLIAFASVFPIVSVLGYDMLSSWLRGRSKPIKKEKPL